MLDSSLIQSTSSWPFVEIRKLLKERKDFNKRFIDYFLEHNLGFNLLISDGSKKTDKNLFQNVHKPKYPNALIFCFEC